jgi:RNA ligase (TIGR02306 family)
MKLAEIQTILDIIPIQNADKIESAKVHGWQSTVKKGEYNIGDKIVFIHIDTLLQPSDWNKFLLNEDDPTKPIRLKTIKTRGVISQGLILPLTILPDPTIDYEVGTDVAELIGVSKYEKQVPIELQGIAKDTFPTYFVSKTDEDNLLSNLDVLEELRQADYVEATCKLDGMSSTFLKDDHGNYKVCSRNLELLDGSNVFWEMSRKYNIQELLNDNYCLQGEIVGPSINSNRMTLKEPKLFIYNCIDISIGKSVSLSECLNQNNTSIEMVPIVKVWSKSEFLRMTIQSLQEFANMQLYTNNSLSEGIVLRGYKDDKLMSSNILGKMLSVKIINQYYKD